MNFLAHLYLSADDAQLRVGNFIGDHVKGRAYENFPEIIKEGILLHRNIDSFTDKHPIVKSGVDRFRPKLGRYASVVIDVVYDHILASNWAKYSHLSLREFSDSSFNDLEKHFDILPSKVQTFLPHMKASDRLVEYSKKQGLEETLERMATYTSLPNETIFVMETVEKFIEYFTAEFDKFFQEIIQYVEEKTGRQISRP